MKLTQFGLFAVGLQAYHVSASMRPDIKGAQVVELEPGQKVTADTKELPTTMGPDSDFEFLFRCPKDSGKVFAVTADNKYLTCCLPGQVLVGTAATELRCCGGGHDLAGSAAVGFSCCPTGQTYDGKVCKVATPPEPVCINGKALENGKCVCPSGTSEAAEGHCAPVKCSSGIKSGKCYTFTFDNGFRFGYNVAGWYTASRENLAQQFGKFKLCKDEKCTPGADFNPADPIRIMDIHGQANGGQNPNQWVNNAQNGAHIGKTAAYATAGVFSLSKWPCGKYCLGGIDSGIGPTCPSELPAATFTSFDKQSCIPIDLMEVPCDIHALENNCIWKNGADQCCNAVDCSGNKETHSTTPPTIPGLRAH